MSSHIFTHLLMVGVLGATASRPAQPPSTVPGTYELLVCQGRCSFDAPANVVVKGVLVLAENPFSPPALNTSWPGAFTNAYGSAREPNACFVVDRVKEARTYAGSMPLGMTAWSLETWVLRFHLYVGRDASYVVTASMMGDGFEGTGRSSGPDAEVWNLGHDVVMARRVGPADIGACIKAAKGRDHESRGAV